MFKANDKHQTGGSMLGNIILIALFAYGIYLGIQFVPIQIESMAMDSVLESLETQNQSQKYESAQAVEQAIKSMLNLNQKDEMIKYIKVRQNHLDIAVEIEYQRELDLLFSKHELSFNKILDLD